MGRWDHNRQEQKQQQQTVKVNKKKQKKKPPKQLKTQVQILVIKRYLIQKINTTATSPLTKS